ncbi:MAG: peptidase [Pseudomonadota bacterium]
MTYCVGIKVDTGLIFVSDSRTNAGVDQISTYSKMHTFGIDGSRQFCLLTAGNLATSQAVVTQIRQDLDEAKPSNLATVGSMSDAADYVGAINVAQIQKFGGGPEYESSLILGGQISGDNPRIMLIYPQGNHIRTSKTTPFMQIGESKYGKPILDRIIKGTTSLQYAAQCGLVSMDSTMRSNVTVGPPIELMVYHADSFMMPAPITLEDDSEYLRELKRSWDQLLIDAFHQLPPPAWASTWDGNRNQQQLQD